MIFLHLILFIVSIQVEAIPNNLVIAHRGVPYFAPEETAPAYQLARALGADYLEADLQRTSDGVIIALHDNDLRRTTDILEVFPERAKDPVSSFTWSEISQLDAGSWFNKKYPDRGRPNFIGLKILTLNELIDLAEAGINQPGLYLETKLPELFPGIEKELRQLLEERGWFQTYFDDGRPKVILQTFSPESLQLLHQEFPEGSLCWLMWAGDACLSEVDSVHFENCLLFAKANGAAIIGPSFKGEVTYYFNLMKPWMVKMANQQGFLIHPYTFNTVDDINNYAPQSQGQFTNRTDLLLDYYQRGRPKVESVLHDLGY